MKLNWIHFLIPWALVCCRVFSFLWWTSETCDGKKRKMGTTTSPYRSGGVGNHHRSKLLWSCVHTPHTPSFLSSTLCPTSPTLRPLTTPQVLKCVKMETKQLDALRKIVLVLSHRSKETMTLLVYIRLLISLADAPYRVQVAFAFILWCV